MRCLNRVLHLKLPSRIFCTRAEVNETFCIGLSCELEGRLNHGGDEMKKILFLSCLVIFTNALMANPILLPQALISEFRFQSPGKWELEINFATPSNLFVRQDFDSILVGSSTGLSRLRLDYLPDSTAILVVTSDSLVIPLSFNPDGDCIRLYSYQALYPVVRPEIDSVSFGNYPGSMLDTIPNGYSICRIGFGVFTLDKDPTIGEENDTSGTCGTLKGLIYNGDGTKIESGNYTLGYPDYHPITLTGDGSYSVRVFARRFEMAELARITPNGGTTYVRIDTLRFAAHVDSVTESDIHFADVVGVKRSPSVSSLPVSILNYPNPFNPSTNFAVTIPNGVTYRKGWIDIYNSIGQKVFTVFLTRGSPPKWNGVDMWGRPVSSGVYYYRLCLDGVVFKTGSMILLK